MELKDAFIHGDREYSIARTFLLPGVMGSDIAADKVLIIDYPNRHLSVQE